ncbi:STAS domain-containing protein [Streptomyces sp. NPDC087512]|uniref:STAS domain-containing protein n=1 Tax=unclassified Streptomyces TaxID=2593676 RepID=UPI0034137FD0
MDKVPEVQTSESDGIRTVTVGGEFDPDTIGSLSGTLLPVPEGCAGTVLDLADVLFADSAFLHLLLRARQEHASVGVPLVLARPSTAVSRLLDVTDTARAFTLAPSVPAAAADIRTTGSRGPAPR